jgi:hypothetical protein
MAKIPKQYGSDKQAPALRDNPKPDAQAVEDFHSNDDIDSRAEAHHHSLGPLPTQASPGDHMHDGGTSPLLLQGVTITGSRGGNAALVSVISALVKLGATDNSVA